jgi:hypothetical protein
MLDRRMGTEFGYFTMTDLVRKKPIGGFRGTEARETAIAEGFARWKEDIFEG